MELIIPKRSRCDCGKIVENHHYLCDKCWGKKKKAEDIAMLKKRKGKFNKPKWMTPKGLNT